MKTKKQIIVDGVNVKDCKRRIGKNNYCRYYKRLCSENNYNCIWKKYLRKEQELKNICKAFDIEYAIDEETGNLIGRCNKLYKKEQECEKARQNAQDTYELYQALMESFNILQGEKIKLEQECEKLRFPMPDTNYAILTKEEFEQLDKLKLENEKLKKECEICKNQVLTFDDEIITVQITQKQFEEYNKLKTENDTLRQFLSKEPLALQALQSDYASYKKSSDVFYEMVKQYKQTLTEIKDIAKNMNEECFYDDFDCMNCDMQNGCTYFNKKKILQKIRECEAEK